MSIAAVAGIAVAGAIGAPSRYLLDGFVQDRSEGAYPWGTFVINVTGSFLLGLITGAALYHGFRGAPKLWLGTGFCGAYTTFSTFTFETVRLFEEGDTFDGLLNVGLSVVLGCAAAALGLALAGVL